MASKKPFRLRTVLRYKQQLEERLQGELARLTQVIADLRDAVKQACERLEQAMKDRKIIEDLQEKARITQKQQTLKEEERALGEMALRRFAS